jgi:HlyD family secretion protein
MATAVERQPSIGAPRWRLSRKARWGLVAALFFFGLWLARSRLRKPEEVRYETVSVTRGSLRAKVTATGTLSALVTVQVGSQV